MELNFRTTNRFFSRWPTVRSLGIEKEKTLLVYDRRLEKVAGRWIRQFPLRIPVSAGEKLKTWASAEKTLGQILNLTSGLAREEVTILSMGGGSVGDFAGFCASILRRGTRLIQVPSTWLAAIDSAHGGKTALNLGGKKNQVGTFWPATEVWLIRPLLLGQPEERLLDARGEIFKTALLAEPIKTWKLADAATSSQKLWLALPELIATKMKLVLADPYEKKGRRHVLNLGHTLGHVIEGQLKYSHGEAVLYGLAFAVAWQSHREKMQGRFSESPWISKVSRLEGWPSSRDLGRTLKRVRDWSRWLGADKKAINGDQVRFVIPEAPGKMRVEKIPLQVVIAEIHRQVGVS